MKIAVDAMGGDYAPKEVVEGIELARDAYSDVEFQLFGKTDQIKKYLKMMTGFKLSKPMK